MTPPIEQLTAPPTVGVPFAARLAEHGERVALVHGQDVLTYRELADRIGPVAAGLGPQRRLVGLVGRTDVDFVVRYLAALSVGHPVAVATDDEHLARLQDTLGDARDLHPELALLLSTSGSTGATKCVRLSHANVQSNAESIAHYLGLGPDDAAITSLPLHYCYGLSVLHSHLAVGATVVLSRTSVVDDCFWAAVARHRVTTLAGVPHTFDLLDRVGVERLRGTSLRRVTQAGGRWSPTSVRRYAELGRAWGWDLYVMYGQTEATARMAYLPPELAEQHPDCIGRAIPGGTLELQPCPGADGPDEGEIVYRGPNVMMGYATCGEDLALGAELDRLHTGDLAVCTEDGLVRIIGRRSRFAKLFGLRIDLDQVERDLQDGSGVRSSCVEHDGRVVLAAEVPDDRAAALALHVAQQLVVPPGSVQVVPVPAVPRRPNGKPDHGAVAALAAEVAGDRSAAHEVDVRAVLATTLDLRSIGPEDTFVGLGGDSLSYVEVSIQLERVIGRLPSGWHRMTVAELEHLVGDGSDRLGGTGGGVSRWWSERVAWLETDVVVRAMAIVLVVGSHTGWFRVRGGAHVLLAVAGYNFARFALCPGRRPLDGDRLRSLARIVVPAATWLALLTVATDDYGWQSVLLVNSYLGEPHWTAAWRYWFVEALVMTVLALLVVMSVPVVRRWNERWPALVPAVLLGVALVARWDLVELGPTPEPLLAPHRVAWFFVLGWLLAVTSTVAARLLLSALVLVAVPGFFGESARDLVVVAGLLLLTWVPRLPVPRRTTAVVGALAGASLYVYLTHFQVYLPLEARGVAPWLMTAASLVAGWALWRLVESCGAVPGAILGRCRQLLSQLAVTSASPPHVPVSPATLPTLSAAPPSRSR